MGGQEILLIVSVFIFALVILMIASLWVVFTKAGEPGWASIVPIYNVMVECRIAGKPEWWVLLLIIPVVGAIVSIILTIELAKAFDKGVGFALGLIFLPFIFFPILAFGDARYIGPEDSPKRRKRSISRFADEDDEEDYDDRPRSSSKRSRDEDYDDDEEDDRRSARRR